MDSSLRSDVHRLANAVVAGVSLMAVHLLDASFREPGVVAAKKTLAGNQFRVPKLGWERKSVLDLADRVSTVGVAMHEGAISPRIAAEKYGDVLVQLLANPFVQDEALRNPSQWQSVIGFGVEFFSHQHPMRNLNTPVCLEAERFASRFQQAAEACKTAKWSTSPAPGTMDYFLKCDSTRELIARHNL